MTSKQLNEWLTENLGSEALAPLTGTDKKALVAAVGIVQLYAYDSGQPVADAFALIVHRMQRKCWPLAYHAIASAMDWDDREKLWARARIPPIDPGRCKFEPKP